MIVNRNKPAIIWKEGTVSYSRLLEQISCFSNLYDAHRTTKVAIFSENRPAWVYAFFSAWNNNCSLVPIDSMSSVDEIAYILNDCKPEVIFYSSGTQDVLNSALAGVNFEIQKIKFEEIKVSSEKQNLKAIHEPEPEKVAVIVYTSGTTGSPKGVMLTFANLFSNVRAVTELVPYYSETEKVLILLPLHHILPLMGTLVAPLKIGATVVFSPSMSSEDILNTLQNHGITLIVAVPRFYDLILKGIKDKINKKAIAKLFFSIASKLKSKTFSKKIFHEVHAKFGGNIRFMICGGAKLNVNTARGFHTLGFELVEGYGMTETAPIITFPRIGKYKLGSVGQALPECEIKFDKGEILVKGKNVMLGYYNKPAETEEVLKDGWLHTGDLGEMDKEGYLFITGRKKDIIVLSNGKNINPEEIEKKLETYESVLEAGVFLNEDLLHALILPDYNSINMKEISNIKEFFRNEVIGDYNSSVSPSKKIMNFSIINHELPRTRISKLKRYMLNSLLVEENAEKEFVKEPDTSEYRIVKDFLTQEKERAIYPGDHVEWDLALDSLDKVTLQVFIQSTFGVLISEEHLLELGTVEKIAEFINERKTKEEVEQINWSDILKETTHLNLPKSWFTHNFIKNAAKIFMKLYFRLKAEGVENLPNSPFIIAPNHQSFFDGLFVASFLKNKIMKRTYFYAKEKHVRKKWLKFIADKHNVIVMDINRDLKSSIQKLAELLRKEKNVIIFPEGTRSIDGKLGSFKKTFAILSRELNVPVVPVAIKGAFEALPIGSTIPRPFKKVQIKFCDPIYPNDQSYESISALAYEKVAGFLNEPVKV